MSGPFYSEQMYKLGEALQSLSHSIVGPRSTCCHCDRDEEDRTIAGRDTVATLDALIDLDTLGFTQFVPAIRAELQAFLSAFEAKRQIYLQEYGKEPGGVIFGRYERFLITPRVAQFIPNVVMGKGGTPMNPSPTHINDIEISRNDAYGQLLVFTTEESMAQERKYHGGR